jgi:CheY-like chemotaxis protein
MAARRVLSIGQCGADHAGISSALKACHAEVIAADTAEEGLDRLRRKDIDLVLVNRVLDANGASGLEVIRQVKSDPELSAIPVMLVSNRNEAQGEAIQAGAMPGFGKAALGQPHMLQLVQAVLDRLCP